MWNKPTREQLAKLPRSYEMEDVPEKDKIIHLHFFAPNADWYISEYDGSDLFFGYARFEHMPDCAEWGYISKREVEELNVRGIEVDNDLNWKPKKFGQIEKVKK